MTEEFEEFMPGEMSESEFKEEVEKLYGSPVPFEQSECFDDLVSPEEKFCIKALEENAWKGQCPFLKKKEQFFYFCEIDLDEAVEEGFKRTFEPSDDSAYIISQRDVKELRHRCLSPKLFRECEEYQINKHEYSKEK